MAADSEDTAGESAAGEANDGEPGRGAKLRIVSVVFGGYLVWACR